ncbi:2Fe-2S iron-sulfur cluster-binding protein, partial [Acinetobacter baumannii]
GLTTREDGPFVARLPREPGKRESRYMHLFCDDMDTLITTVEALAPLDDDGDLRARVEALEGDTVMTAMLTNGERLRRTEFADTPRAGFCMMGACQDCWVRTEEGERLRACGTF